MALKDEDKIEKARLSTLAYNVLKAAGLNTVGAVRKVLENLTTYRRIGPKIKNEVEEKLKK
jgi:DNA-directed RNA polymerase alpha subunit